MTNNIMKLTPSAFQHVAAGFLALCLCSTGLSDDAKIVNFVRQNCLDCHSGDDAESGFNLENATVDLRDSDNFLLWSNVIDRVSQGEMPPADYDQPTTEDHSEFSLALRTTLVRAAQKRQQEFGRSELRRLSRVEYANSLKDILDLPHLELEESLPPDGLAHGYPKSAKALDFSHVMVAKYLEVADYALWKALASRATWMPREVVRSELKSVEGTKDAVQTLYVQLKHGTGMPLVGTKLDPTLEVHRGNFQKREPGFVKDPKPHFDGIATFMNNSSNHNVVMRQFNVKQSGYYQLRIHGWGLLNDHGKLLPSDRSETVAFYSPTGRLIGRCDVPPNEPTTSEVTVWLNQGEPIEYLAISAPNEKFQISPNNGPRYTKFKAYGIGLQWFEMDGPLQNLNGLPESHRRLLGDLTLEQTEKQPNGLEYRVVTENPIDEARHLLWQFASRAYRRPVQNSDLVVPMQMVRPRLRRGEPFVDALLAGYRAILTSPEFLLVSEEPGQLDSWALASRLSFFLTNSPPDTELRQSAASGRLLESEELRKQTERLLDHPKSQRFVAHFLDYWLDLRHITLTEPDSNLYPEYNELLAESMVEETLAYFTEMIRENLSAKYVVESDFVTINQRMAELYGIAKVHGSHTRKIPLPQGSIRGGLLTQGSLLKITANGTTTSPVVRGTYMLSRLLGDPPPPPPPSVPAIEPDISGATTIREQLARHRSDSACASCHQKIDPPGFALESFDVMGAWRDHYRASLDDGERGINMQFNGKRARFKIGLPVDSAGTLPDGSEFEDIKDFRQWLLSQQQQIARNLLEQLIIYSTGSPVGISDQPVVDEMMSSLEETEYGIRSMIHIVVQSDLFRNK